MTTLFVGESRPKNGTFFYLGDSRLARFTFQAFSLDMKGTESAAASLDGFRHQGFYLVDLCSQPVNGLVRRERTAARADGVMTLSKTIRETGPAAIVVVMKAIEPHVRLAASQADCGATPIFVLPFPAMGHEPEYVAQLRELIPTLPIAPGSEATG